MIPLCVPNLGTRELEFVQECVRGGWISSAGSYVTGFENAVASYVGARGAVAVSSGTTALHLALRMAGLEADEEVIMPALTFIAPAFAVRHHGGWPAVVDVDRESWQLDPEAVAAFLGGRCARTPEGVVNRETGRRVRGILPVHLLGHPAPLADLRALADAWGLWVVEDAAEALGARYADGTFVGGVGRYVCFSFNGNKVVSTGGGGMIVSDDPSVCERGRFLSTQAKDDPIEYVHSEVGYNYRLTNLQAAVGVAQMERIEGFVARKRAVARRYAEALAPHGVTFMSPATGVRCTWWLSTAVLPEGTDRHRVNRALGAQGIETRPLWQPMHQSPALAGAAVTPCPEAERLHRRCLSLPSSTGIDDQEIDRVVEAVRGCLP